MYMNETQGIIEAPEVDISAVYDVGCSRCGRPFDEAYCATCGERRDGDLACPRCGDEPRSPYCPSCGELRV
jgi:hypothetical protein